MPEISDEQRDATLANLLAMNAALEQEAQLKRDAALWRQFVKVNPITAAKLAAMWASKQ